MNSLVRIIGAIIGYFLAGAVGAAVGFLAGWIVEKFFFKLQKPGFASLTQYDLENLHPEFLSSLFSVMGYVVTLSAQRHDDPLAIAQRVMDRIGLPEIRRRACINAFESGQSQNFALYNTVTGFNRLNADKPRLLEIFMELQLYAAYSKGKVSQEEHDTLLGVCYHLDISQAEFERMETLVKSELREGGGNAKSRGSKKSKEGARGNRDGALHDAYAVLNTSPEASDAEVKQAYRRLTSQHHPDKLVAKGMPAEVMRMAEEKTREIRDAYERIKQVRNL